MLAKDRAALRNLLIAILGSTGALLVVGTTCLGRDRARPDSNATSTTAERESVRSSAGGVPPVPVGTTILNGAQLERGASATGSPASQVEEGSEEPVVRAPALKIAASPVLDTSPFPQAAPPVTEPPIATPAPAATPAPSPVPSASSSAQRQGGGAASAVPAPRSLYRTPTEGIEGGAGQFVTEPPPFAASALSANPEAGAGPFITDQVTPAPVR